MKILFGVFLMGISGSALVYGMYKIPRRYSRFTIPLPLLFTALLFTGERLFASGLGL